MPFKSLGLADKLVQGILATGYSAPTAIQAQAIPAAVEGRDILGCAQTGTGKTAAFVLPILHRLAGYEAAGRPRQGIKALVLTPTRELAKQVEEAVRSYGRFLRLRTLAIYGGVGYGPQRQALRQGVDFVVATPGRLIDLLNLGQLDLSKVEVFVLDEADRMFDMGFINDVRKIVARLSPGRQTLLFSATMSREIRDLTSSIQKNPLLIQVGEQRNPVASVTQHVYTIARDRKIQLLLHIIQQEDLDCVLVFSRTKHGADRIAQQLHRFGIEAAALHSNRTQSQRLRALDGFRRGRYRVLVATDIAARGIDVEGISHVINYDTPVFAEDYIHRIGRTGRAASTGDAITFVSREEEDHLRKIERFIGKHLERKKPPAMNPLPSSSGTHLPTRDDSSHPSHTPAHSSHHVQKSSHAAPSSRSASSHSRPHSSHSPAPNHTSSTPSSSSRNQRFSPQHTSKPSQPKPGAKKPHRGKSHASHTDSGHKKANTQNPFKPKKDKRRWRKRFR